MGLFRKTRLLSCALLSITLLFACSDDDEGATPDNNNQQQSASLPSTVSGQVVNMIFTDAQTGAPYSVNQKATFTFTAGGMLSIDDDPASNDGDEVTIASFSKVGSELVWADASNDFNYSLSLKADSSINEVNVNRISNATFLGSFKPVQALNTALIGSYQGSYMVNTVKNGTHNRMTVIINSNGSINFDTNTQFNTPDFARIEDKRDCCDAVTIDLNPYPVEPYARVILYQDSATKTLTEIDYYPNNQSFVGRVNVTF